MSNNASQTINLPDNYRLRQAKLSGQSAGFLVLISFAMQVLMQSPYDYSGLSWICLVPWTLAAAVYPGRWRGLGLFYFSGVVYFLFALRWLIPVTVPGWLGLSAYLGVYYLVGRILIRRIYVTRRWPFTFVLPLIWCTLEYLRSVVMTGFPWFFLAHSQHNHLTLIQIADLTGTYGITFILAMTSGVICDMLLRPLVSHKPAHGGRPISPVALGVVSGVIIVAVYVYGSFRQRQIQRTTQTGPVLAMIQDSVLQSNKPEFDDPAQNEWDTLFASHLELTEQALAAERLPDLIVWPETMAPYLNEEFLNFSLPGYTLPDNIQETINRHRHYDQVLKETARKGVALLVGTPHYEYAVRNGHLDTGTQANAAMLYQANGRRYPRVYWKMHLVPFGETIPFKQSAPWLYRLLLKLTPYEFDYSITPGQHPVLFPVTPKEGTAAHFAVAICYEDVIATMPRKLIQLKDGHKQADFLVNISNDGWYLKPPANDKMEEEGGRVRLDPQDEIPQHMAICQFRAVENRIGIARAVNGGISGFIRPDGSIQQKALATTLPVEPADRAGKRGYITDSIATNPTVTFYTRFGDIFAQINAVMTLILSLTLVRRR